MVLRFAIPASFEFQGSFDVEASGIHGNSSYAPFVENGGKPVEGADSCREGAVSDVHFEVSDVQLRAWRSSRNRMGLCGIVYTVYTYQRNPVEWHHHYKNSLNVMSAPGSATLNPKTKSPKP